MNKTGTFKNRTLLWEQVAPAEDPRTRPHEYDAQPASTSAPTQRPRLGFSRRATENLEPVYAPEPITLDENSDEQEDFRPRRAWWRPRSKAGRITLLSAASVALISLCIAGYLLRRHVLSDPGFVLAASSNVQVTGASDLSRNELLPVFSKDMGKNLFTIPIAERRKELEQVSWVQHATVMRVLPNQLRVNVVERTPIAFVRQTPNDVHVGLVDADGVLLQMPAGLMAQHHYSFPVVTGIDARDPINERRKRMAVYQRLIQELDSGPTKYSSQISEIDLRDPADARVLMPEPGGDILAHFGSDHFLDRFQTYQQHISEWRQQYPKLATVDLRYDQQVILRQSDQQSAPAQSDVATQAQPQPVAANAHASAPAAAPAVAASTEKTAGSATREHASAQDHPQKNDVAEKGTHKGSAHSAKKKTAESKGKSKKTTRQKPAVKKTAAKHTTHTEPATGE